MHLHAYWPLFGGLDDDNGRMKDAPSISHWSFSWMRYTGARMHCAVRNYKN